MIRDTIAESFYSAHDGHSIDWLLANPKRQAAFHNACRESGLIGSPADWNRELLRLRKTGEFPKRGPIQKVQIADDELNRYSFAAEIAWAWLATSSPALCSMKSSATRQRLLSSIASQSDWPRVSNRPNIAGPCLRLRKASRELVDEVKRYHFVFAKRDFGRFHPWDNFDPSRYTGLPGIYLLRGEAKQPLYIGRTIDLGRRLAQHEQHPILNDAVTHVSLIAGIDLPAEDYQAAFKEELVRRYQPRWNVNLVGLGSSASEAP